jgi:hypothetical protein
MATENIIGSGKDIGNSVTDKGQRLVERMGNKVEATAQRVGEREPQMHAEGPIARLIESQTARLPSDVFMWAAFASIGSALFFKLRERDTTALFVGQWAPTLLLFGLYNKIVKVAGSDRLPQDREIFEGQRH